MVAWLGTLFGDPTKLYHATGWLMLVVEIAQSWIPGHTVDMNVITVGFGLIAGGVVQDRVNTPPVKA